MEVNNDAEETEEERLNRLTADCEKVDRCRAASPPACGDSRFREECCELACKLAGEFHCACVCFNNSITTSITFCWVNKSVRYQRRNRVEEKDGELWKPCCASSGMPSLVNGLSSPLVLHEMIRSVNMLITCITTVRMVRFRS